MTREYLEKRKDFHQPDRLLPGKAVDIAPGLAYVAFVPDYDAWNKTVKKVEERERARRKALAPAERAKEVQEARKKSQDEEKFIEASWEKTKFSEKDFDRIIAWIEANKGSYSKPPAHVEENPYAKDPFGMHHVFFSAANGFLQAMDPHSAVIDRESWDKIKKESENSTFEGIGALLSGGGTQEVVVETPLPGSPALNAGLRAGDVIRRVDGKSVENIPLSDVVKRIRGPRETYVQLDVERPAELTNLQIRIKRGVIEQKAVTSKWLGDQKVGVIKVSSFLYDERATSDLVRKEFATIKQQSGGDIKGLVLDLRGNPGGYLDQAIHVAGLFLPRGKVVVEVKGKGGRRQGTNDREPIVQGIPLIVMVNAGSASASEIVASALQDHNVALIVGERTFGKASVQGMQTRGDVIIKLTTDRYYAPRGYTVQVNGVEPDIQLSDEVDGTFPPRFREEDMWKHLPELEQKEKDPARDAWLAKLKEIVGKNEEADKYLATHKTDALKPDYMLVRALTYFNALKVYPHP